MAARSRRKLTSKSRPVAIAPIAAPVAPGAAFSVLALLAGNAGQPMPLRDLQAASGTDYFADAIKRLQDLRYIALSGGPSSESAQLTEFGAEIASLARKA